MGECGRVGNMDKIRAEFEKWWDSADDITNSGPWAHDTPIQFAWDAWQAALSQREAEPVASSQQDGWTFDELDLRGPADFETTAPEGWESSDWRTCLELKAELHNKRVYRAEIKRLRAIIASKGPHNE